MVFIEQKSAVGVSDSAYRAENALSEGGGTVLFLVWKVQPREFSLMLQPLLARYLLKTRFARR